MFAPLQQLNYHGEELSEVQVNNDTIMMLC